MSLTTEELKKESLRLVETGECYNSLIDFEAVAGRVAKHESFSLALHKAIHGDMRFLNLITVTAAIEVVRAFS